jgi:hypothetical protein
LSRNSSGANPVVRGAAIMAVCAGVAVVFGLWRAGQTPDETPEAVVAAIYRHCQAGEYGQTARHYLGGPETDDSMRRSVCDKITEANSIKGWYQRNQKATPDGAVYIQTQNYRDEVDRSDGRTLWWQLVRRSGRWRVAEVV